MRSRPGVLLLAVLLLSSQAAPLFSEAGHDGDVPKLSLYASERLLPDALGAPVTFSLRGPGAAEGPFALKLADLARLKAWQIQIFDFYGKKVAYLQGQGRPESLDIPWSGFSSDGAPLKDGAYAARLVWTDDAGAHQTAYSSVMLMSPPELKGLYAFDLKFLRTRKGLVIRIGGDLLFGAGRHDLHASVVPALQKIATLLRAHDRNRAVVRGFTDSVGALAANLVLSRQRAEAVYRFLVEHGIASSRLAYEGLGSQEPIDSNDTPAGRSRNRRVEVVLFES